MSDKSNHYQKAKTKYEAGDYSDAVYWFTRHLAEHGDDADIFSDRGVAFFHLRKLPEALADLSRSRDLEPENPYRYASRAYIRDAMGDLEGAIADYEVAIKLDPDDAVAHNNLGLLEEKRGYHAKAKALFNFADRLDTDARAAGNTESLMPKNIQSEINREANKKSLWGEAKQVLTNRTAFKEFITFIGNGFR